MNDIFLNTWEFVINIVS